MIWFDRTSTSIVVGCHRCGARDVVRSQSAADRWAGGHLRTAHPDELDAARRRSLTAARVRAHRRNTP